ncbi:MAG: proline--tRNA ligase [Oscillibacter sp.]|nr:proline--tRNA ligase [Oscillibacter sp.]
MAKEKKVEQITDMEQDFAQWFTDVCTKAELVDYSGVKGLFILRPYGYAIWENIQKELDRMFKEGGHENVSMPMLIPESLLQKEKDHVEGFAPECAWVTVGGSEELTERLCIRPTSETLFCDHWSHTVHSWRDLPMLYNQWCSVLRWEKTTRPFLRGREFLWQEGHTLHATEAEAREETLRQLEVYADLCENYLAMPVIRGNKTEKEKFAGAVNTYTIECMMHDHKALQSGTSHYFGTGFAEQFGITFTDKDNKLKHPHQTSWGLSTRVIGGIIMTHGDNNGLVLPPRIAPTQVVIVPIAAHKNPEVLETAKSVMADLIAADVRVKLDDSDQSMGWKCAEYEMRGVPIRLELGPRDLAEGNCCLVRRDNGEKVTAKIEGIVDEIKALLDAIHDSMYTVAEKNLEDNTFDLKTIDEVKEMASGRGGFARTKWCGSLECELKMKEQAGVSSRCMPLKQSGTTGKCVCCGKECTTDIYWGVAY